jgi:hypothetical protein
VWFKWPSRCFFLQKNVDIGRDQSVVQKFGSGKTITKMKTNLALTCRQIQKYQYSSIKDINHLNMILKSSLLKLCNKVKFGNEIDDIKW